MIKPREVKVQCHLTQKWERKIPDSKVHAPNSLLSIISPAFCSQSKYVKPPQPHPNKLHLEKRKQFLYMLAPGNVSQSSIIINYWVFVHTKM